MRLGTFWLLRQMFDDGSGFIEPIDVQCSVIEVPTEADLRAPLCAGGHTARGLSLRRLSSAGVCGSVQPTRPGRLVQGAGWRIRPATAPVSRRFLRNWKCDGFASGWNHPNLLEQPGCAAARQMLDQISYVDRLMDFTQVAQILSMLNLDWTPEHLPHASSQCDADLALAKAYFQTVFNDGCGLRMRNDYDQAVTAAERGDHMGCLLHTAAIRRAYLETVIRR